MRGRATGEEEDAAQPTTEEPRSRHVQPPLAATVPASSGQVGDQADPFAAAAVAIVADLPTGGRTIGKADRGRLSARLATLLAAGWDAGALAQAMRPERPGWTPAMPGRFYAGRADDLPDQPPAAERPRPARRVPSCGVCDPGDPGRWVPSDPADPHSAAVHCPTCWPVLTEASA